MNVQERYRQLAEGLRDGRVAPRALKRYDELLRSGLDEVAAVWQLVRERPVWNS